MSPESGLMDPVVLRKRNLLRVFYAFSAASAISFAGAQYVRTVWRIGPLVLSIAAAVLAVWVLVRFPGLRQSRVISTGRREIEWAVDISLRSCYPRRCERAPVGVGAASHRTVRRSRRHLR